MEMGKWIHRITSINESDKTATCSECGIGVKVIPRVIANGSVRWICALVRAERKKRTYREKPPIRFWGERHGLKRGQAEMLLDAQFGRCAICKTADSTKWRIDHCHSTKLIRGILCARCNILIVKIEDNKEFLSNAVAYLNGRGSIVSKSRDEPRIRRWTP